MRDDEKMTLARAAKTGDAAAIATLEREVTRLDRLDNPHGQGCVSECCNPARVGVKFERGLPLVEIAKRVRLDIKAAVKADEIPAGVKVSVRCEFYSMGQSLHVKVTGLPASFGPVRNEVADPVYGRRFVRTEAADKLIATLEAIVEAYRRDESKSEVDYFSTNFYPHVDFSGKMEA